MTTDPAFIDAHLHLWDLGHGGYRWLGPQHGELHRSIGPDEARAELAAAGALGAVLVQADDTEADTAFMLDVARRHDFVRGVVGWVRLDDPAVAERQLDAYGERLVGVRHLVHTDPRDDFFELSGVRTSLAAVAARGLVLDVPDAWPRHLRGLPALADALPELTLVVDHLAKPPRGSSDLAAWERELREVARRPNVVAKVSGLQMPALPFTAEALRPVLDVALDAFGPWRLMVGSDWPMTLAAGGYQAHWRVIRGLVLELEASAQRDLLHDTARRVYRLPDPVGVPR